jgi:hypothetical protein
MFAFALLHAGLTAVGVSMAAHQRAAFRRPLSARSTLALRLAGWLLIAVATGAEIAIRGWGAAIVTALAQAAISGFLLTLLLTFAPRRTPHVAAGFLVLGTCAALFH